MAGQTGQEIHAEAQAHAFRGPPRFAFTPAGADSTPVDEQETRQGGNAELGRDLKKIVVSVVLVVINRIRELEEVTQANTEPRTRPRQVNRHFAQGDADAERSVGA